jgi:amidohydrolase
MFRHSFRFIVLLSLVNGFALHAQEQDRIESISKQIDEHMDHYQSLYKHLHQNPELSFQEFATSDRMAEELGKLNFKTTRNFGGTGIVGVFENGDGPVIMLRTDMDALPIEEKTGLPYASKVTMKNENGEVVPVMHACGHDIHMTVWVGTANTLVALKDQWKGTLLMIAQQAEEKSGGANAMINEGLFSKFPVPDYAMAFHISPELPSTTIGYCPGATAAGVNSVDITVYGEGGHGAYPHKTRDPVVLASRIILDLQTVVSREISPLEPAVVTVGSIHGGTQHNIIPDQVRLQLTVRFYHDRIYHQIIEAISRITTGIAISAGLPEEKFPEVTVYESFTPPVINDPVLTELAIGSFRKIFGNKYVTEVEPTMAGEDFGRYGRTDEHIPIFMFWVGTVNPEIYSEQMEKGISTPPLHSPYLAPDYENSVTTGIKAMSFATINLFQK